MTSIAIQRLSGDTWTPSDAVWDAFRGQFLGDVFTEETPGYDETRRIFNAMIDRSPAVVARCANAADTMRAVSFAADNDLLFSVRGGGHGGPGHCVQDGGLVVDLGGMRGVRVDPSRRTARVDAGCRWREVDHATHAFGLATVSGIIATTGVAGLTLGGGHGHLSRQYGLTVDNLLEADVVLADGRMVTASEDENPDLFWAIRGGGGNFGAVTSFLFRLHPVSEVFAGVTLWPMAEIETVLKGYRDFLPRAPRELSGFFASMVVPPAPPFPKPLHGRKMASVVWCYNGPAEAAKKALAPIRDFGPPAFEHLGTMPYPALQGMFDDLYPPGLQWYWKGDFVRNIPDEAVAVHKEFGKKIPTGHSTMHLYPIDGRVNDAETTDTPFAFRDVNWSMVIVGVDPDPANAETISRWARDYWEALRPLSAGGGYVNFMMGEGEDRLRATYGENFDRLVRIKDRYDPENRFRMNHNIPPSGDAR